MARLRTTIIKELLSYLRDPGTRRFMIGAPILQTVVFAFAATLDVQNLDVAVLDQDGGRWAHELVERIDGSWFTDELIAVHDMASLDEAVSQRQLAVGVRIGADFSRDIAAGQPGQVQLILDGRRANTAQIASSYIQAIVAQLNLEATDNGAAQLAPTVSLRHRYNTNLNYRWFMVVNLAAVQAFMLCLIVSALSIAREREMGTFDQMLVSPLTPMEIVIAKTFPAMLAGFVVFSLVSLLAVLVFGAPFAGSIAPLLLGLVMFLFAISGLGLLCSAVCRTQQQAFLNCFFGSIPLIMTSGFTTPVNNMPLWLQHVAELNPVKHFLLIMQGSFFKAQSAEIIFSNVWPLLLIALVTFTVAILVVQRKLE